MALFNHFAVHIMEYKIKSTTLKWKKDMKEIDTMYPSGAYAGWTHGQPNNIGGNQYCGCLLRTGNTGLQDEPCNNRYPYICDVPGEYAQLFFCHLVLIICKISVYI